MDRQSREDHIRALFRQQRALNGARARYAECVGDAISGASDEDTWTVQAVQQAKVGIARCQDEFYGAFRGDIRSALLRVILDSTRFAYNLGVQRSREIAEKALAGHPDLLRALKAYGRERDG